MPVSESQETGSIGESEVEGKFKRIGWNPVRNSSLELGTDYLIEARDFRRRSRGLIVGAQVKAGPTYFKSPRVKADGTVSGWWYYESDTDHFDDWVTHGLPHLLVLYDLYTQTAYWAHVTASAVASTGQGCKILVPASQTVDPEHADALFAVACKQKAAPSIEGTAFFGALDGISPARRLRYALIAPRLVAPHPSAGTDEPIDALQAVALLAQGRLRDLLRFAEKYPSVPDPQSKDAGSDWTWRFVEAIWAWVMTDSVEQLEVVLESAHTKDAAAASGVLLACALQRLERHEDAVAVLDRLVGRNDLLPVDHGWALVQRGRARAEIGDAAGARSDSAGAQGSLAGDEDDITASALAAAAAWLLFATTRLVPHKVDEWSRGLAETLTASDTAVLWWRSQKVSWGLQAVEGEWFKSWAQDRSYTVIEGGGPNALDLFAAEFSADITGEHSNWRAMSALAARQRLMGASTSNNQVFELKEGLDALRRSGDHQSLKLAVERLHRDGPLEAVSASVDKIPMSGWTHTSALCNLEALALAGDLIAEEAASGFALQCAQLMNGDMSGFVQGIRPGFMVPYHALRAAIGLIAGADDRANDEVAGLIAIEHDRGRDLVYAECAKAINHLEYDRVTIPVREALWRSGQQDRGQLGVAILGWLAVNGHSDARTEVISRAAGGDLHALDAMGDMSAFDSAEAASLIVQLEGMVERTVAEARQGSFTLGGLNAGVLLTLLNLAFPQEARWGAVVELLCEPAVASHDKRPSCLAISELSTQLPAEVRETLAANVDSIGGTGSDAWHASHIGGVGTLLAIALEVLHGDDADAAATALAFGSTQECQDISKLLSAGRCPALQPLLAALVANPHPDVRYEAGIAVGRVVVTAPTKPIQTLAWELAKRDGTWLPYALLVGMACGDPPLAGLGLEIAQHLQTHASARVRRAARRLLL